MENLLVQALEEPSETAVVKKRGRPARLSTQLLAAGMVWCVLHGWISQWELWRRISCFGVGSLAAVAVCDQAIELDFKLLKCELGLHIWWGLAPNWCCSNCGWPSFWPNCCMPCNDM